MVKHDFTIHAGQDFNISYVVPEDSDRVLTGFNGVCKIRKRADEGVIFELNAEVGEKYVTFSLSGATSAAKKVNGRDLYMTLLFTMTASTSNSAMAKFYLFKIFLCMTRGRNHGR